VQGRTNVAEDRTSESDEPRTAKDGMCRSGFSREWLHQIAKSDKMVGQKM